jgi:hypothetical protein
MQSGNNVATSRTVGMPRGAKVAAVLLAAIAAVVLAWAVATLSSHPISPDGVSYPNVWHCRPGHGAITGGEMTDAERQAITRTCQQLVRADYDRAVTLLFVSSAVAAGAVAVVAATRTRG